MSRWHWKQLPNRREEAEMSTANQASWSAHLTYLRYSKAVTSDEALLLDIIVKKHRPLFWAEIVSSSSSPVSSGADMALERLVAGRYVSVMQLEDPNDGETSCLYYPGLKVVEWFQVEEKALTAEQRAELIIQRRVPLPFPALSSLRVSLRFLCGKRTTTQTEWFRRERDGQVLARWQAGDQRSTKGQWDDKMEAPLYTPFL